MSKIRSWGDGDVERVDLHGYAPERLCDVLQNTCGMTGESMRAIMGSVRAIGMSPSPEHGYDPIPLMRAGEKTHTLRGTARILGTVNQVSVNGARIPLWLRWVARERVTYGDVRCREFAIADGISPADPDTVWSLDELFKHFHGRKLSADKQMWLLHFEVFCDLMDELEGRWEM